LGLVGPGEWTTSIHRGFVVSWQPEPREKENNMPGSPLKDAEIVLRGTVDGKSTEVKLADVPNPKDYDIEQLTQKFGEPATATRGFCEKCHGMASDLGDRVGG
jgi:hypothetical protein